MVVGLSVACPARIAYYDARRSHSARWAGNHTEPALPPPTSVIKTVRVKRREGARAEAVGGTSHASNSRLSWDWDLGRRRLRWRQQQHQHEHERERLPEFRSGGSGVGSETRQPSRWRIILFGLSCLLATARWARCRYKRRFAVSHGGIKRLRCTLCELAAAAVVDAGGGKIAGGV